MFNDYPICMSNLNNGCIREQDVFRREPRTGPEDFRPCPCFHQPRPPFPPFPPYPPLPPVELAIRLRKVDACSNTPLSGATFELLRDGAVVGAASTPADGQIIFPHLYPGRYQLRETVAPPNYKLDPETYEVDVCPNGAIAVNGNFTRDFVLRDYLLDVSLQPQVNPVAVLDPAITGTGVSGCVITVYWPDGQQNATTVNGGGTWAISIPELPILVPGEVLRVTQTCPQMLPSEGVYVGVRVP